MITPESAQARFNKESERFHRLIGTRDDLLHTLLKGHLLIEEQLFEIIHVGVAEPAQVDEARLSFAQALRLAKAVAGAFLSDEIVQAVRKVGALRNQLAHNADSSRVEESTRSFIEWCRSQSRLSEYVRDGVPNIVLLFLLGAIWAQLTGARDALSVVRQHQPLPPAEKKPCA